MYLLLIVLLNKISKLIAFNFAFLFRQTKYPYFRVCGQNVQNKTPIMVEFNLS